MYYRRGAEGAESVFLFHFLLRGQKVKSNSPSGSIGLNGTLNSSTIACVIQLSPRSYLRISGRIIALSTMKPIISVRNIGKRYKLGLIHEDMLSNKLVNSVKGIFTGSSRGRAETNDPQEIWALKEISLDITPGEVVGIIGRNGAGKSTLLKILSGITEPTEGEIVLRGRVASLLEVGTGFHGELTGRENIYLNGAILGMRRSEIRRKFDEIVEFAGVEKFIDTPVKRYSSGMYVRLAFAVAAHLEPEILLVDEVLAVGDLAFQKKCLGKMKDVTEEEGRTVLFVSHNMAAIYSLCERVILLHHGRIEKEGATSDVVTYYQNTVAEETQGDTSEPGLWNIPKRDGHHQSVIERIEMLDPVSGDRKKALMTGDSVAFRLHYRSKIDFREASIMFGVFSTEGVYLLRYNTEVDGIYSPIKTGTGSIDCVFERFPLTGGTYVLATTIGKKGIRPLYQCYNYGNLEVLPRYTSKTKHAYDSKLCFIHAPHRWVVEP